MLPVWQRILDPLVAKGKIVAIGIVQEQHADRTRLYAQWRQLDWRVLVDSLNLLDHAAVPIAMLLDERGVVQVHPRRASQITKFLKRPVARGATRRRTKALHPMLGDEAFLKGDLDAAVSAYKKAIGRDASNGRAHFRLGVALRARHESSKRQAGDGQAAVAAWGEALRLVPNQYIWRRRIQQYGPRLEKPYDFYGWVAKARLEIEARGEKPHPLAVEPRGAELIGRDGGESSDMPKDADPKGKINRDTARWVAVETIVTPARVRPGRSVRVRLVLRVDDRAWWNNEADPVTLHVAPKGGLVLREGTFVHDAKGAKPESREVRVLEFELAVPSNAKRGRLNASGYLLYNVCEEIGGTCLFIRQDVKITIEVDPAGPRLGK